MRFWKQVLLLLPSTAEDIFPSSLSATGTRTHSCGTKCLCVSMVALNHTVTEGPGSFKHWAKHQKFKSAIKKQTDLTIKRWDTALRSVRSSFSAFWKALLEEAVLSSSSSIHPLCSGGLISHRYLYIIFFMTYQGNRKPPHTSLLRTHSQQICRYSQWYIERFERILGSAGRLCLRLRSQYWRITNSSSTDSADVAWRGASSSQDGGSCCRV